MPLLSLWAHVALVASAQAITVSSTSKGGPILPSTWLGLNFEWSTTLGFFASPVPTGSTPPRLRSDLLVAMDWYRQALGTPIDIKLAGNSVTRLYWTQSAYPPPAQYLNDRMVTVDPTYLTTLAAFFKATNASFQVSTMIPAEGPARAVEFVKDGLVPYLGTSRMLALTIGNEPDHYVLKGHRPEGYSQEDYFVEWRNVATAIRAQVPEVAKVPLQGMNVASDAWWPYLVPFGNAEKGLAKLIGFHRYGGRGCSQYSDINTVLEDPTHGEWDWLDPIVSQLAANGQFLVWDEGNSLSCGGKPGASDTFAAALWLVHASLELASHGVYRGFLHSSSSAFYSPLILSASALQARPVYCTLPPGLSYGSTYSVAFTDGMLMTYLAMRASDGQFQVKKASVSADLPALLGAYQVFTKDGTRLVLINKASQSVSVSLSGFPTAGGKVYTLSAAGGPPATQGVSLSGWSLDNGFANNDFACKATPTALTGSSVTVGAYRAVVIDFTSFAMKATDAECII